MPYRKTARRRGGVRRTAYRAIPAMAENPTRNRPMMALRQEGCQVVSSTVTEPPLQETRAPTCVPKRGHGNEPPLQASPSGYTWAVSPPNPPTTAPSAPYDSFADIYGRLDEDLAGGRDEPPVLRRGLPGRRRAGRRARRRRRAYRGRRGGARMPDDRRGRLPGDAAALPRARRTGRRRQPACAARSGLPHLPPGEPAAFVTLPYHSIGHLTSAARIPLRIRLRKAVLGDGAGLRRGAGRAAGGFREWALGRWSAARWPSRGRRPGCRHARRPREA